MLNYDNNKPLSFKEILQKEIEIYKQQIVDENISEKSINIENIFSRKIKEFKDKTYNFPQNIFIITLKDFPPIVWRKIISNLYIQKKINAINCSQITASMLLWFLVKKEISWKSVFVKYRPFSDWEKITIFKKISKDRLLNIFFPFKYINFYEWKEKICSPKWWSFSPEREKNLSNWEEHFRNYTYFYFKNIIKDWFTIYDPACSTWAFLSFIKNKFPWCRTIWQDLSKEMTDYAKNFVDEIYTWDAIYSPISDANVDIIFLRFLNLEIVTEKKAYKLFDVLEKKVKIWWYIVLFWHTSVLIQKDYFSNKPKFKILQSSWYNSENNSIFQYYILKKLMF